MTTGAGCPNPPSIKVTVRPTKAEAVGSPMLYVTSPSNGRPSVPETGFLRSSVGDAKKDSNNIFHNSVGL